jgi:predicted N-acetyltransferase YhbS
MAESVVSQPTADQEGGQDSRYTIAFATVDDAKEVFDIINDAYSVETGNTGVAFKNELRLVDPLEEQMLHGYNNQTILKCVDTTTGKVVGVLSFEHRDEELYFGPFAVASSEKGHGIGKLLLRTLKSIGIARGFKVFKIRVINHRTDLFPMYYKWVRTFVRILRIPFVITFGIVSQGFYQDGQEPYPEPDRLTRPAHFEVLKLEIERLPV